jgi:hypothetical protein
MTHPSDPQLVATQPAGAVGGCLHRHLKAWKEIGADEYCLKILEHGYTPEFMAERPPLTNDWHAHESATSLQKQEVLKEQVVALLAKEAIVQVKNTHSRGFYSNVFLVPRRTASSAQ